MNNEGKFAVITDLGYDGNGFYFFDTYQECLDYSTEHSAEIIVGIVFIINDVRLL
jgi:hypothetical protein